MILEETFTLANGVAIPKLGLGTWRIPNAETARVVRDAIELGYRHIDTAQAYGNEHGVGEGLRDSGASRDQIFVTTKLVAESSATPMPNSASTGRSGNLGWTTSP